MKIFGKTLKEYVWPARYFILISVLVVISQYYIGVPLSGQYPFFLNLTQALWALMVTLAVFRAVRKQNFGLKNVLVLGVIFSVIIHGLKAFFFRVFLFPYNEIMTKPLLQYILGTPMEKFIYGSFLVMSIAIIIGIVAILTKKEKIEFFGIEL